MGSLLSVHVWVAIVFIAVNRRVEYDSTELVKKYTGLALNMLVDQRKADIFYMKGQLLPGKLSAACASNIVPINLRIHELYDNIYYFIATFIEENINHHAKFLFQ
ncbi:S-formylglutathione hydrolase-like [Dreissena polymorpha]|uniref:S-formylglutathione hydrolase-like n=1 Tax=Dreissena polymorpha TaxID=45954 RepID=UPI0022645616|nr:S-formylglutathione hydrolase-like [Dreissena polymorpha]